MSFDTTKAGTRDKRNPGKMTALLNKLFIGRVRKGGRVMA